MFDMHLPLLNTHLVPQHPHFVLTERGLSLVRSRASARVHQRTELLADVPYDLGVFVVQNKLIPVLNPWMSVPPVGYVATKKGVRTRAQQSFLL